MEIKSGGFVAVYLLARLIVLVNVKAHSHPRRGGWTARRLDGRLWGLRAGGGWRHETSARSGSRGGGPIRTIFLQNIFDGILTYQFFSRDDLSIHSEYRFP